MKVNLRAQEGGERKKETKENVEKENQLLQIAGRTPAFFVFLWIGILGEKILFTTKYQERRDVRIEVNVQVGGHRCSGMRRQVSAVEALSLSLFLPREYRSVLFFFFTSI